MGRGVDEDEREEEVEKLEMSGSSIACEATAYMLVDRLKITQAALDDKK